MVIVGRMNNLPFNYLTVADIIRHDVLKQPPSQHIGEVFSNILTALEALFKCLNLAGKSVGCEPVVIRNFLMVFSRRAAPPPRVP